MTRLTILFFVCMAGTACGAEKLIVGFELHEMEQKTGGTLGRGRGVDRCLITDRSASGFRFSAPFEAPKTTSLAWTWHITRGDATEGQYALAQTLSGLGSREEESDTYKRTPYWTYYYPNLKTSTNPEAAIVMNTYLWLINNPALRDWSGYDKLLIDMKVSTAMRVQVALEDEMITPPVMRAFEMSGGEWFTLEIDLKQAAKERQIDLQSIANFWILGFANGKVCVDNIRLAQAKDSPSLSLLHDRRSMALPDPSSRIDVPELHAVPDRSRIALERPKKVCPGVVTPFGFIGAFDNNHIIIGYNKGVYGGASGSRGSAFFRFTTDGGGTWSSEKTIGGSPYNLDHGSNRGNVVDDHGNAVFITSSAGCAGIGRPNARQHLFKVSFNGSGWDDPSSLATSILDGDTRHCAHTTQFVIRQRYGKNAGRLWCSWGHHGRLHGPEVVVAYSDDDGKTWCFPKHGRACVPGSRHPAWTDDTYQMPETAVTQYGEHVAVFWEDDRGLLWSVFDGQNWSAVRKVHCQGRLALARGPSLSAVTAGMNEVLVTSGRTQGVMRLQKDGKTWDNELKAAAGGGCLTVCGTTTDAEDDTVMYFTAGLGGSAPVLCYRRKPDGSWASPLNLTRGKITVWEYRRWVNLVVPPYSPPNFAPVAWGQINQVKMAKVPVLE